MTSNKRKHPKGSRIHLRNDGYYHVMFTYDGIVKETSVTTKKEAETIANQYDVEYFKENKRNLPLGISFRETRNTFYLSIHHPKTQKTIALGTYRTVREARKAKRKVLNSLIGL